MEEGVHVITLFNRFPELEVEIQRAIIRMVKDAAFKIQKQAALRAPVDTGLLKSSIYVVTHTQSTYGQAAAGGGDALLPELEKPQSPTTAYVAVGANYGVYVEFGTVNAGAQPYLLPATEAVAPEFIAALEELEASLEL